MKDFNLKDLTQAVENIAKNAGTAIMRLYNDPNISTKDDGSVVTNADHAAEDIILNALSLLTPDVTIVSEERVAAGDRPDISTGTFWTVDPLDGTSEFVNKTGAFAVAIALIVDNTPALGVIYHPGLGVLYSGYGAGTASKLTDNGVRTTLSSNTLASEEQLHVLVNVAHADMPRIQSYLTEQFSSAVDIDGKSGILRACQIAENKADMAVVCAKRRNGRTAWWDVAPGHAIVESAGGSVKTLDGQPLRYDAEDLQVPPHIVIAPQLTAKKNPEGDNHLRGSKPFKKDNPLH